MAKRKLNEELAKLLLARDIDGVIYDLAQIVWSKRDEAADRDNRAEEDYWQQVGQVLSDCQVGIENLA